MLEVAQNSHVSGKSGWRGAPDLEHRALMLVAEKAPSTRFQIEKAGGLWAHPEPSGGENAEAVGMCDEKGIASKFADLRDDAVHTRSDILSGFAIGTRLVENSPARRGFADFCCREAFVFPVIPLTEVIGLDGLPSPTDKIACPPRTKTGAAEDESKVPIPQEGCKGGGAPLAFRGQWNVGDRGVAST